MSIGAAESFADIVMPTRDTVKNMLGLTDIGPDEFSALPGATNHIGGVLQTGTSPPFRKSWPSLP